MSLLPDSNTPGNTPHNTPIARAALRRSFTVPPKLASQTSPNAEIGAAAGIETLYVHPTAKIVSFTTSAISRTSSASSRLGINQERDGSGTLPWTSPTERTLAAGPLEIYRVPGSVSFLHSGSLLHAILPRSQCWCVDEISTFVFRVLPNQYYRIELPAQNEEEKELVEQMKITFKKVLFYEKTESPFKRGFEADVFVMPDVSARRGSKSTLGPAKRWTFDRKWRPEGAEDSPEEELATSRPNSIYVSDASDTLDAVNEADNSALNTTEKATTSYLTTPSVTRNLAMMRSVTAPPQLSLQSSPPSKVPRIVRGIDEAMRETMQSTPLRSETIPTLVLPPTPESMQDEFTESSEEQEDILPGSNSVPVPAAPDEETDTIDSDSLTPELAIAPQESMLTTAEPVRDQIDLCRDSSTESDGSFEIRNSPNKGASDKHAGTNSDALSLSQSISSSSSMESWTSLPSTPPESFRLRRGYSSTTSTASYHSVVSLLQETSLSRTRGTSKDAKEKAVITGTGAQLVRKTCAIFLGPSAYLVKLMLRIAHTLVTEGMGEFGDYIPAPPAGMEGHRRIPGSWNISDDEEEWDI